MVEEFMLLANIATAEKTLEEFPDCALLRRHPSPPASNFDPVVKVAEAKVNIFTFSSFVVNSQILTLHNHSFSFYRYRVLR